MQIKNDFQKNEKKMINKELLLSLHYYFIIIIKQ